MSLKDEKQKVNEMETNAERGGKVVCWLITAIMLFSSLAIVKPVASQPPVDAPMDEGDSAPDLQVTELRGTTPVIYLGQRNRLVLSITNFGTANAKKVVAKVTDIVPNTSETIISSLPFGELAAGKEKQRFVDWYPQTRGIHYIKIEITSQYLTHNSPAELVESPPTILSVGFPVSPFGSLEYWGPNDPISNIITATEGTRYRDGSITPITIIVREGNLEIESGAMLQLNDSVTFVIENTFPEWYTNKYSINIESGGKFLINSPLRTTTIQSSSSYPSATYPFLNSGTVDFLGANVMYTYGDKVNLALAGGIQNMLGSVCNIDNCSLIDADTHSLSADGNVSLTVKGENTVIGSEVDPGTNDVLNGHGIFVNKATPVISGVSVKYQKKDGIALTNVSTAFVHNNTIEWNGENGILLQGSYNIGIHNNTISSNMASGIYLEASGGNSISNNAILDNGKNGIHLVNSIQAINADIDSSSYLGEASYSEDTILIKLGTSYSYGAASVGVLNEIESRIQAKAEKTFAYSGVVELKLDGSTSVEKAIDMLSQDPSVQYAEPDYIVSMDNIPDDPGFGSLWGLHNTGQTGGIPDADIDAPEAWIISTGSSDVVVAVVDTGVDYNHPDLADNMWKNPGETGLDVNGTDKATNGKDDDGNGYVDDVYGIDAYNHDSDPMGDHFHGTHCAGTIGAIGNNGTGVVGVNWNVSIMALKFFPATGGGPVSAAIECLEYVIMMKTKFGVKVNITSNSWGGTFYSQALYDAIAACRDAEILFVAAAGNDNVDTDYLPHYPSSFDLTNIISVAATDHNDELASFSNYGANNVDVAAPGVVINSTLPTYMTQAYGCLNGTSMATPHVAGLAALIASTNPSYDYVNLKNLIMNTVDHLPNLTNKMVTEGRINAYNALSYSPFGMLLSVYNPHNGSTAFKAVPVDIIVSVSDGIQPIAATVSVSFSNGETPLMLRDDGSGNDQVSGDGYYSGSWIPLQKGTVVLNISASAGGYTDVCEAITVVVTSRNAITNNTIAGQTFGIMLSYSTGNLITNNDLSDNAAGIYMVEYSRNNFIENNTISNTYNGINLYMSSNNNIAYNNVLNNGNGISLTGSTDNTIINNTALNNDVGILLVTSFSNTITNNTATSNNFYGICIKGGNGVTIANNTVSNNGNGISIVDSTGNLIENNAASGNDVGISCSKGGMLIPPSDNTIVNNIVSNNDYGIRLSASIDNAVTNNTASNNEKGIYLSTSTDSMISHNTIFDNAADGIYLDGSSDNIIDNNTISNNQHGIYIRSTITMPSSNNNITNNIVSKNNYGIYTVGSSPRIFNNTIGGDETISYHFVSNETVYGPTTGGEMVTFFLEHGNVTHCVLYLQEGDGYWNELSEGSDYFLAYATGEIDVSPLWPMLANWTFYAYYEYTVGDSNIYGIYCVLSEPVISFNEILLNVEDGIRIDNQANYVLNPMIDNNSIIGNGQGIYVFNASATIIDNDVMSNKGPGIFLEKGKGEISLNTIMYNHEPATPPPLEPKYTGIKVRDSSDVEIHNNNISYNTGNIYLYNSNNITIEWNEIVDNAHPYQQIYPPLPLEKGVYSVSSQMVFSNNTVYGCVYGMHVVDADGSTSIRDNTFIQLTPFESAGVAGIVLEEAPIAVEGNTINNMAAYGILCLDYSDAVISDNTIMNCGYDGIRCTGSSPTIINNHLTNNNNAIYAEGSTDLKIQYNYIASNANGIILSNVAGLSTYIDHNNIENNDCGIWCKDYSVLYIAQNNITSNIYGIYSENYADPLITSNNIVGNTAYGVCNADMTTPSLTAISNWWGDLSGPYNPVTYPTGLGDWVSEGVDGAIPLSNWVIWW